MFIFRGVEPLQNKHFIYMETIDGNKKEAYEAIRGHIENQNPYCCPDAQNFPCTACSW